MFGVSSLEGGHLLIIRVSGRRGRALQSPVFATTKGVSPDSQLPKGSPGEKELPSDDSTQVDIDLPGLDLPVSSKPGSWDIGTVDVSHWRSRRIPGLNFE